MTKRFIVIDSVDGFKKNFLLQTLPQKVEFSPKQIFSFDHEFIVESITFTLSFSFMLINNVNFF